jgi:TfoX/Sxy family transcriptional regulator of competence genes
MAYDEALAARVRDHLTGHPGITERKMFGGVAFMKSGNMAVGVSKEELMVRVDPQDHEGLLGEPGVHEFDLSGRPMKGWILVAPSATSLDLDLERWIDRGLGFAGSLPPK